MSLMQRESRNYLFDFLRPHHILFGYFTKLVEQYTKVFFFLKKIHLRNFYFNYNCQKY
jgi:hypothetical protein